LISGQSKRIFVYPDCLRTTKIMRYREKIPTERLEEFESIGENEVRANVDARLYGGRRKDHAIVFLKMCESERDASLSARQEARAEEALSISRSALRMPKWQLIIAIVAIASAIIIAILA